MLAPPVLEVRMKMSTRFGMMVLLSAAWMLAAGACAIAEEDRGNEGAESFLADLPADTELGELGEQDFEQLCETTSEYLAANLDQQGAACQAEALNAAAALAETVEPGEAELRQGCADTSADCLREPYEPGVSVGDCSATPAPCTATVGQLTSCVNLLVAAPNSLPACETLTAEELAGPLQLPFAAPGHGLMPLGCAPVVQGCPGLIQFASVLAAGAAGAGGVGPANTGAGAGGAAG
jgi:hypothetical protein